MTNFPFAIVGFDLDGTLLDTHEDLGHAVNHALALAGRAAYPIDSMRDLIGGGAKMMLWRALSETGGEPAPEVFKPLYKELLSYYEANIATHTRLFPGGEAMLDALAARDVAMALITNKFEYLARHLLTELGLIDRFYIVLGGDTLGPGRSKPAPDQLLEALSRAPVQGRAAYVGDTTYDILAAQAAGWPSVACSFGFNNLPPHELDASAVIDHFDDLIPTLERL